jgi:hypothetical protein
LTVKVVPRPFVLLTRRPPPTVVFDKSSVEAAVTKLSLVPKASNDRMPAVSELLISNVTLLLLA